MCGWMRGVFIVCSMPRCCVLCCSLSGMSRMFVRSVLLMCRVIVPSMCSMVMPDVIVHLVGRMILLVGAVVVCAVRSV